MFYISRKNWDTILGYSQEAYDTLKSEIGGMSVCVKNKDGDWEIQDPVILKQEVSGSNCTLDQEELSKYYTRTAKKLGNKEFRFCWWHSHHTMKAFWSSTDITAIEEFNDGDFSFALVVNLKEEYKFRVSVWNPVEAHEDVELEIRGNRANNKIKKDVEDMCSKESIISNYTGVTNIYNWKNPNYTRPTKQISYYKLRNVVEEQIDKLVSGESSFKQYKKKMREVQEYLEENKSQYTVKILTAKEVKQNVPLYSLPDEYIVDPQTKLPFEAEAELAAFDRGWIE